MTNRIYFISGPAGVGKSTTSTALAERIKRSAYISGDLISHLPVSGHEKPWESVQAKKLVWENLIALTKNFIKSDFKDLLNMRNQVVLMDVAQNETVKQMEILSILRESMK